MSRSSKKAAKRKSVEDLLNVATQTADAVPPPLPKRIPVPPLEAEYSVRPTMEQETSYRQRRDRPINNSTLPPLDWMSALDKYCPLKNQ
jgi:hypothetical protein